MANFATVNEAYARHFPAPYPARSTVAASCPWWPGRDRVHRHCRGCRLTDTIRAPSGEIGAPSPVLATAAIVLRRRPGTRMRSRVPKVLHPLAGRPMIDHVLAALAAAGVEHPVVVTGFGADQLEAALQGRVPTVRQDPQLGTADACAAAWRGCRRRRHVLVTMGDVPLLPADLFQRLLRAGRGRRRGGPARRSWPTPPAKPHRAGRAATVAIVEEADTDESTRPSARSTWDVLLRRGLAARQRRQRPASPSGEYYLPTWRSPSPAAGGRGGARPRAELTTGINDGSGWPPPSACCASRSRRRTCATA